MSYKISTDLNVTDTITVQGKTVGLSVTTSEGVVQADTMGRLNISVMEPSIIDYVFKQLPLSQFGSLTDTADLGITATGFTLNLTKSIPLFMGGQYFTIAPSSLNLAQFKSNPQNTTFFMYVQLYLGTPRFIVSETDVPETSINMYIGNVVTNASSILSNTIQKVSRLDTFRASTTPQGTAFPVSTGNPLNPGTITW